MTDQPAEATFAGLGHERDFPGFEDVIEIGRGGFGTVYRAVELALGRVVAVKVLSSGLDRAARDRFAREGLAMSRLSDHPNVVPVYRVGVTLSDRPYLVMPLIPRGSAAALLEYGGPLSWQEAVRMTIRLAGALETAHRAGILHRDIKPANILLSEYGEPLLSDFGIARVSGGFETTNAQITATLAHAAPEVLEGRPPSAASDVYSLGSTLFALLTGHPPFELSEDEALMSLYRRIARDPIPDGRDSGVPDEVCAVIEQATAKVAADRPTSAAEFGTQLQDAQRSAGVAATAMAIADPGVLASPPLSTTATVTGSPNRPVDGMDVSGLETKRSRRWLLAAPVVAAVAAAVVLVVVLRGGSGRSTVTSLPATIDATPGRAALVLSETAVPIHVEVPARNAAEVRIEGRPGERVVGQVHLAARPLRPVSIALLAGASPLEEKSITNFDTVIEPVQFAADATYVLRIGPSQSPLDATLELALAPSDVLVNTVIGGAPVRVSLTQPQQRALVSFDGNPGLRVRVRWTWSGPNPSYTSLSLAGPDGAVLANWSALSTGSSLIVTLAGAGRYSIGVSIDGGVTGAGDLAVVAA